MRVRVFGPVLLITLCVCLAQSTWSTAGMTPTDASPIVRRMPAPYQPADSGDALVWAGIAAGGPPSRVHAGSVEPAAANAARTYGSVPVIVTLDTGPWSGVPDLPAMRANVAALGTRILTSVPPADFADTVRFTSVPALAGIATAAGLQALASHPDVARVSVSRRLSAQLLEAVPSIRANEVHDSGIAGTGVTVAVLDTGIDTDHPMLADSIAFQQCFLDSPEGGACPGGVLRGPTAEDDNGHGSHVSGIITSNNPVGVAPNASIGALKVLDAAGNGETINVLLAYDYIINEHPDVDLINMSLSDGGSYSPGTCEEITPALTEAVALTRAIGITTFAATGNTGSKTGIGYPACINDVVAVGATYDADYGPGACGEPTALDVVTCFSQSGAGLDLLAPGYAITSAAVGGGTATLDGTSMSSSVAAGVAALLLEQEPALSPAAREARLIETGVPVLDAANGVSSCRVDALRALSNEGGAVCALALPPRPPHDDQSDAVPIRSLPFQDLSSTFAATTEPGEPTSCGGINSTVWYTYTPEVDQSVLVSSAGSGIDAIFTVFRDDGGVLTQVGCRDFGAAGRLVSLAAGVTYLIQLGGSFGASGDVALHVSEFVPPDCPTVQTSGFTTIDPDSDAFGLTAPNHEILSVAGALDEKILCLTVNFAAPVQPADGDPIAAVAGFIDFDVDQDLNTGNATIDSFCPSPSNLGAEATLNLFDVVQGLAFIGAEPVFVDFSHPTAFTVKIPLAAVGGDAEFNFGLSMGSIAAPTDCAPDDGGCIVSPAGSVCVPPTAPANDDFLHATIVEEPLPHASTQSNLGATLEPGEQRPCGDIARTVWYRYTPSSDTVLLADTFGSAYDTVLALYEAAGSFSEVLRELECSNDFHGKQSRVSAPLDAGTTYYLQAGGAQGGFGALVLNVRSLPQPECPEGNDGFEGGLADDDFIPCWQTADFSGSFGAWCTQRGTQAPAGPCEGSVAPVEAAPEQDHAAMTGQGGPGAHALYRCGHLASDVISFELYLNNGAASGYTTGSSLDPFGAPNQQFRADLVTAAGMAVNPWTLGSDVAMTFYQTRPGDAAVSGYRTIAASVEPFRGQHVCIRFVEVDNQGFFHAGVDDIEVSLSADAPTSTPTSTATPTSTRTLTPTPTATPSPTTLGAPCADTNGDGVVTVSDVLAIARHLGRRRFDPHYDINRDGRVTVADLLIAVRQWRTRCEA